MTSQDFKASRAALNLTQRELAAEWGMGANGERTVRRWESGERPVNPIAAYCIALMVVEFAYKKARLIKSGP